MDNLGEYLFFGSIGSLFLLLLLLLIFRDKTEEKAEQARIKKSLQNELIYDPITRTNITLEEAENGNWGKLTIEQQHKEILNQIDLSNSPFVIGLLKVQDYLLSNDFKVRKLTEIEFDELTNLKILDDDEYWLENKKTINVFENKNSQNFVYFPFIINSDIEDKEEPTIIIKTNSRITTNRKFSQLNINKYYQSTHLASHTFYYSNTIINPELTESLIKELNWNS